MLLLKGNNFKSKVVEAMMLQFKARTYVYYDAPLPMDDAYIISPDECSVKSLCDFIYHDVEETVNTYNECIPINLVVIYTNLSYNQDEDFMIIEELANRLEERALVANVMITCK